MQTRLLALLGTLGLGVVLCPSFAGADPTETHMGHYCVVREQGVTRPPNATCEQGWRRLGVGLNGCRSSEVSFLCRGGWSDTQMAFRTGGSRRGSAVQTPLSRSGNLSAEQCVPGNYQEGWWRNLGPGSGTVPTSCRRATRAGIVSCRQNQSAWICDYPSSRN